MPGWFNVRETANVIHRFKTTNAEKHMVNSRDTGKSQNKIKHPFMT
jgi:hypothetical protein